MFVTRHHNTEPNEKNWVPVEVFRQFFSLKIAFIVINEINCYERNAVEKWNRKICDEKPKTKLTSSELDAVVGILFADRISHNYMETSEVLWPKRVKPSKIQKYPLLFNHTPASRVTQNFVTKIRNQQLQQIIKFSTVHNKELKFP